MTIAELSSLGVIKFTGKYLKELCIGGFIAQTVNKNHSYSIYWVIDQRLWRKKNFSMRSIRRDHILNEIVHSGFIGITANKYTFVFKCLKPQLSVFCPEMNEVKQKSLFFSLLL